jgi:hypothetical protein
VRGEMVCSRDVAVLLSLQSEMWEFGTGEYKKDSNQSWFEGAVG